MITVFTPLILADDGGLLPQSSSISERRSRSRPVPPAAP
jgi:hypothetical protein